MGRVDWTAATATAILLILSFPNFELSFLAWIALVPLLWAIVNRPSPRRAFLLGWTAGSVFFYASCYWLTYSMINYGGLPRILAYLLLIPGALVVGLFPGLFALTLALAVKRWGYAAVLTAPVLWPAFECARLGVTGQLWNALGYSQAYHKMLIQAANWGGVYAVSFLIVAINTAIVLVLVRQKVWTVVTALVIAASVGFLILGSRVLEHGDNNLSSDGTSLRVIALQPNVPMTLVKSSEEINELRARHLQLSQQALAKIEDYPPRLVVWPESPMNFTYAADKAFQEWVAKFAAQNRTSLIFNSLEPAGPDAYYNSALLVNQDGRMIAQYDKIRLMPFGEYVPFRQWLPGTSLITTIVGEFTPGENYTLMPVADYRVGVFICIESAYPWIARRLTNEGADVLINISNDGYLGPTAVMRQHLANAIFRAVENGRPVLRVTNTGVSAWIEEDGRIREHTVPFQEDVRTWTITRPSLVSTIYREYGDVFVHTCAAITLVIFLAAVFPRRRSLR
ncbi:MAG TPA: apolipoprotein N-acyltransferase [Pyrinomonadaceae bacterium]|nr:apolipoprotein N-acyltransferase [Pyrinomonadaceae bacterium]